MLGNTSAGEGSQGEVKRDMCPGCPGLNACPTHHAVRLPLVVIRDDLELLMLLNPYSAALPGRHFPRRGESGFRRVGSHLEPDLVGLLPEGVEEIASLAFAASDDLATFGITDGVGDLAEHRFHLLTHLGDVSLALQRGIGP
jgi:hypothetical protein